MATISGILTDGAGQIINDCTIELYAKKTTTNVLTQTQAFTVTSDGRYSMNVLPCEYDVSLIINGFPKKRLGTIHVYSDSVDGSLNDFLINLKENELTPDFLKQVFDARDVAKKSATQATNSATAAKTSEINAQSSADTAKLNATNASVSASSASKSAATATEASTKANTAATNSKACADNASKSETAASQYSKKALDSAEEAKVSENNAKTSEQNAKKSADDAKKFASTIDTSKLLKIGDAVQLFGDLSNINLNSLTGLSEGVYFQGKNIQATTENNYPINEAGTLQVFKNGADGAGCCQIYTAYRNARQFIRNYRGGTKTWEPWVEQITTANINKYIPIGDQRLMPFRRDELPFGWYFRNGDNFLLDSPQGQALNGLSANYKRDHNITIKTINGKQYINVPTAFASDGRGYFERAVNGISRQVGSPEDDAIRDIWGHFDTGVVDNHSNYTRGAFSGSNAIYPGNGAFEQKKDWPAFGYDFHASNVVPTASENRPLNIGMTPVIYLGV